MFFSAIALFTALAIPVRLRAQDNPGHNNNHKLHHYRLIDLCTFGGPSAVLINDCAIGGGGACGVLNSRGTVVSQADTSSSNPNYLNANPLLPAFTVPGDPFIFHAFRWHGSGLQDLGTLPGGYNSFTQSISPSGLIAGASENGAFDPLTGWPAAHATLWQNHGHSIVDLGTLEGGYESEAFFVNDRAQVVGFALNTIADPFGFGTQLRAFLWQNGVMQDLGTLGTGTDAAAYWINQSGQVAGVSSLVLMSRCATTPEAVRNRALYPESENAAGGGEGNCVVNSQTHELNGSCIGPGFNMQCQSKYNPQQCPVGAKAERETNLTCGLNVVRVDAARTCID